MTCPWITRMNDSIGRIQKPDGSWFQWILYRSLVVGLMSFFWSNSSSSRSSSRSVFVCECSSQIFQSIALSVSLKSEHCRVSIRQIKKLFRYAVSHDTASVSSLLISVATQCTLWTQECYLLSLNSIMSMSFESVDLQSWTEFKYGPITSHFISPTDFVNSLSPTIEWNSLHLYFPQLRSFLENTPHLYIRIVWNEKKCISIEVFNKWWNSI